MPRWKALPDELDPEVREFADRLRALVDHSGLSVAAVSDRTGYSKTSWERYLNGRLLAPKGAVVALAEVTGTQPVHLITLWELAERAWSRSEMRHDMTMQAIRISQARAALGELGGASGAGSSAGSSAGAGAGVAGRGEKGGPPAGSGSAGFGALTGVAGPAGVSPTVPPPVSSSSYGDASASPFGAAGTADVGSGGGPSADGQRWRRKVTMFLAGVVGALVVIAVVVFLPGLRDDGKGGGDEARQSVTPSGTGEAKLPDGVECRGADCVGKDPEGMGCGGELAKTASRATVGRALIEVRYSKACGAAWARITRALPGDEVTVTGAGGGAAAEQKSTVDEDFDAYTPMVAVKAGSEAKACAVLASGRTGCTE
ncbi:MULTISPECIES: helix-turn-helix domain-containing protein [Streptomyces]|uniref:helix-turn-helix domain-containing protein n=1 Tax=Streptomyces TaxID=1883 RepID=UPI001E340EB4|nr:MULTISPECIES: XRE family transcriptional regulator [Streptomyces]UFQ17565.1 XRE family transcriptional regulator [Streptomyces huasconensis]WCL87170.1 DUF2690 domain-containing protein [Streptomyces sp. JCM 35825]